VHGLWFHDNWFWSLWKALEEEGCMGFGSMMFGLGLFGKLLRRKRGAWALVPWCLDLQCKSLLNIEWFLHWKLN
jgi:hypothetical protein